MTRKTAEEVAVQALTFIAGDATRLGRFLATTGIGPDQIRDAAREPQFLAGVLDYAVADERLLAGLAAEAGIDPNLVAEAQAILGGHPWEREVP